MLQKTTFSFDVSVWEFFWPLMTGARLVVARPGGHQDASYLVRLHPGRAGDDAALRAVDAAGLSLEERRGRRMPQRAHEMICSGEALSVELEERFFERMRSAQLHNLYGPTEAAVDVSYWAVRGGTGRRSVPIGRPIANISYTCWTVRWKRWRWES